MGKPRKIIFAALVAVTTAAAASSALAASSAVILMYHRFGETQYPSTNTRLDQFAEHIKILKSGPFTVLPVPAIVAAIRAGKPLPDRTVGLTIDDAYRSIYTRAWPLLRAAGLPFTVFVATGAVDANLRTHMTWTQIRELAAAGVTIGGHSQSHAHMADASVAAIRRELGDSNASFKTQLGKVPELFAYPYGEASLRVQDLVRDSGHTAAFGQHSGVVNAASDFNYLPRFALNENYGAAGRFRLVINALPLPVSGVIPRDPLVAGRNPPVIGFSVDRSIKGLDRLACFSSREGKVRIERLGETRFEIRPVRAFPRGRSRINCTLPTAAGRWRWMGRLFYVPK